MPIQIYLDRFDGEPLAIRLPSRSTANHLKHELRTWTGISARRHALVYGEKIIEDEQALLALARWPEGLYLDDVIAKPSYVDWELRLTLVTQCDACSSCGAVRVKLQRCRDCSVRYCDTACQRVHWPVHKHTCSGR